MTLISYTGTMQPSIFTKIIKKEIPASIIYEDEKTLAFLDIHPIRPGHVLVIPKTQVDHFDDLDADDYQAVFETVQKVAKQIKKVLGVKRACLRVEGFDVPHAHVHVIPCDQPQDFYNPARNDLEPDFPALTAMAEKLRL
jgi:histidine triad (HIT) family protein